jgi:CRISPR/Cas system-associated protein Cas10 (large subunit of type III CRISPR-Cas system)
MELPEINVLPVHSLFLPVQNTEFKFVPYTVDQERNILTAFDSKDVPAIVDNYKKMIDVCGNGVDYDKLTAMEFILIAVNLRSKSKGEILEITTKCEKCGLPIEFSASIEDHIVTDNAENIKDICKIDDNLSFEIVPVKMPFLYKVESIKTDTDLMLETAIHSISKVFWMDDIYTEFTPETLKEKISLTHPILKKIFASSAKLIKMTLKLDIECTGKKEGLVEGIQGGCGHKKEYVIRDFLKYLS